MQEDENYLYLVIKKGTIMPQVQLPFFPEGMTYINSNIGVQKKGNNVYYFNGTMPIYHHDKDDYKSFRYITSQMYVLSTVSQMEIVKCFGISKESAKRWVKVYRKHGGAGFFGTKKGRRKGRVLNEQNTIKAQALLNIKKTPKEIEDELGIKQDTLRKAIRDGRLAKLEGELTETRQVIAKSDRSIEDSKAPMGVATTNTFGRIEAITKKNGPAWVQNRKRYRKSRRHAFIACLDRMRIIKFSFKF